MLWDKWTTATLCRGTTVNIIATFLRAAVIDLLVVYLREDSIHLQSMHSLIPSKHSIVLLQHSRHTQIDVLENTAQRSRLLDPDVC